ncbi:MAG: ATP-binding protein [Acidiferrobacterales bacterium]|nr:ATP-binding protein [Acidiferrobacterales bacterium]
MIDRIRHEKRLCDHLGEYPVVGLIGTRQVGKTTLARNIVRQWADQTHYFDLESSADVARLSDAMFALSPLRGLVVLDEVHRLPDLFPAIRVLADRESEPAKFLILSGASPSLLRQGGESLAGRIAYYELPGLNLSETGADSSDEIWLRGGFPKSFTASTQLTSYKWRRTFIRTFLDRDLPQFGVTIPGIAMERFWMMLAHCHGQVWNGSEIGRAFGVSHTATRRYLEMLQSTFVARCLQPWHANIRKRQIKAPKAYIRDSGILHGLLGIRNLEELHSHPKVGASWEGFVVDNLIQALDVAERDCLFWATHTGAEIDMIVNVGGRLRGYEIKRTASPAITPSIRSALEDLDLDRVDIIYPGEASFALSDRVNAVPAASILSGSELQA